MKEGSVEKRFPDADGIEVTRRFKYTDKISGGNVDTSSIKSTVVSGTGSAIDLTGDLAGAIADTTLGTSVSLRATDANGNRQQVVAVERANFYGYMADELPTGWDLADREIARKVGTVSGFSASIGVVFRDAEQLLNDPGAFIDGMRAMLELVAEADPAVIDRLIDGYIQQFEQKQEQNNPYDEGTTKYRLFEENWYEGYALGFLSKLVVSGGSSGAKNAIKSTDRVGDIADRLSDSRALRALSRIDGATDTAKARVTARLLLATDDAAEPLLSQADTAGQAYRLWRLQRSVDVNVDAMPEARQQRLGEYLARTGNDGARLFDDLDPEVRDDFLGTPCRRPSLSMPVGASVGVRQQHIAGIGLAGGCSDIGDDLREQLTAVDSRSDSFDTNRFLKNTDADSRATFSQVDDTTATRMLVRYGEGDLEADHLRRMNELLDSGDMDQADAQRMMEMLETKDADGSLIDDSITGSDLIDIAESDKSNLAQTRIVGKTDDGQPLWFERGEYEIGSDENHGWVYLKGRHIDADQFDEKSTTTIWPNG
ncbi:hypothetical protein [Natrinema sp. 74]|uniref:hypothetical protein n=1 Tax=Natrinema sp. 74 TaxID=3384159 RepID=UPI0038D3814F